MVLVFYSVAVVLAAWIGGALPLLVRKQQVAIGFFISFGAGILLGAALLHMLPDAASYIGPRLGGPALLGFLTLYIFEKFLLTHPCPSPTCDFHRVGISAFVGLSLHSLITGLALGAGVLVPHLGGIIFLAILMHKIPASLSLSSLLVREHYRTRTVALIVLIFSVMVPIGAALTYLFAEGMGGVVLGYLIAFSAGTFLHVAADDLVPEVHHALHHRNLRLVIFLGGIGLMWALRIVGAS